MKIIVTEKELNWMKKKYIPANPQCERCANYWGGHASCHEKYASEDEREGRIPCELFQEIGNYIDYDDDEDEL
jgi:hypothetical protein